MPNERYSFMVLGNPEKPAQIRFIKSRAEWKGIKVYYVDMRAVKSFLETCLLEGQSIFQFLAWAISGESLDHLPKFDGAGDFCNWV
jgi:hypothetical protein